MWTKHWIVAGLSVVGALQAADVDGDGDLDLIASIDSPSAQIRWYENPRPHGDPRSSPWTEHTIGNAATGKIVVGDVDGNGSLDVLVNSNDGQQPASLFLQSEPGSWQSVNPPLNAEHVVLSDIDGDGDLDAAGGGSWLETPSDPLKGEWISHKVDANSSERSRVLVTDMNKDKRADFLFAPSQNSTTTISLHMGSADPKGGLWAERLVSNSLASVHGIHAADVNHDGIKDLLVAEGDDSGAGIQINAYINESNNSSSSQWTRQTLTTVNSHLVHLGDLGGDGDIDVIGLRHGPAGTALELLENTQNNDLPLNQWTQIQIGQPRYGSLVVVASDDFTGDGLADILLGDRLLENPGGGMILGWPERMLPINLTAVLAADIDTDGLADVVARDGSRLYWLKASDLQANSWAANPMGSLPSTVEPENLRFKAAQIVPGGAPEVIVSGGDGVSYFHARTSSTGLVWSEIRITSDRLDSPIGLGDIDRDGNPDILGVVSCNRVVWWRNPGTSSASWTDHAVSSLSRCGAGSLKAVDLDGDQLLDILVSDRDDPEAKTIYWLKQPSDRADAAWTQHMLPVPNSAHSLTVADLNNDGHPDLITSGGHGLYLWENRAGASNWVAHMLSDGLEGQVTTLETDLDADGDLDLVALSVSDGASLHILRNDANTASVPSTLASSPPITENLPLSTDRLRKDSAELGTLETRTATTSLSSGLVAYWRFDEGSGTTATDSSGNGYHGALKGPSWTSAKVGGGLDFDGSNDYIDLGPMDIPKKGGRSAMAITAWFKADSFTGPASDNRIISKADSSWDEQAHYWMLSTAEKDGSKRLRFRLKTDGVTKGLIGSAGFGTGEWIHAAATYDGQFIRLYQNGIEVGSTPATGFITKNNKVPAEIGRNPGGYRPFDGIIDEVRIYERALTLEEIRQLAGYSGPDNAAPVAKLTATPTSGQASLTVSFDGSASSDPDGSIASYSWNFGDGSSGSGSKPSHTYSSAGSYTAKLTVKDNDGAIGTASVVITANDATNQPPVARMSATPTSGLAPLKVYFDGSASSDPDGAVASYLWSFGDGASGTGSKPSHTYSSTGSYTAKLTVTDNDGAIGTASVVITVGAATNQPPEARLSATPTSGEAPLTVNFDGSASSDPDGAIASYSWSFGDGTNGTGSKPSHTYSLGGTYTVTLTVVDNNGATDSATAKITVDSTTASTSPDAGLIAYWSLNEGTGGTASDSSGNGHHGTLKGPSWTSGKTGAALDFDGSNDYVDLGTMDIGESGNASATTITAWFKADSFTGPASDNRIISKADSSWDEQGHYWMLSTAEKDGSKRLRFRLKTDRVTKGLIGSAGFGTGEWIHAAATYDGQFIRLYQNGIEVGSTPATGFITKNNKVPAEIGRNPGGYRPFDGIIDEVRIYNRALTLTEIQQLAEYSGSTDSPTNSAPVAKFTATPTSGDAPLLVSFDATASSDPDGSITSYSWDFGDGATGTGAAVSHEYQDPGTYLVVLQITDNGGLVDTATITISVADSAPEPSSTASSLYRINAGGSSYVDSHGRFWAADSYFNTGIVFSTESSISGTNDDFLFQSERYDPTDEPPLVYSLPVSNGLYRVNLYFAEIYDGTQAVGARVFDVVIENQVTLADIDIFASVGGYAALVRTADVEVNDGTLNIQFNYNVENPKINAIEIYPLTASTNQPPTAIISATPTSGPTPLTVTFDAAGSTDPDGSIASYSWNFGDGTQASGSVAQHTYFDSGNFTATLTVTDNAGATGSASVTITASDSTSTSSAPKSPWFQSFTPLRVFYVSPNGSGSGTFSDPMSLSSAMNSVKPGDLYYLRGGKYSNRQTLEFSSDCTQTNPCVWKAFIDSNGNPERVTFDGQIIVKAAWNWFWAIESTNTKTGVEEGCFGVFDAGVRLINSIAHDCPSAISTFWNTGPGQLIYGNVLYRPGVSDTNNKAHATYTQNSETNGTKYFVLNAYLDCAVDTNNNECVNAYTTNGKVHNFHFEKNVFGHNVPMNASLNAMAETSTAGPVRNITIKNNLFVNLRGNLNSGKGVRFGGSTSERQPVHFKFDGNYLARTSVGPEAYWGPGANHQPSAKSFQNNQIYDPNAGYHIRFFITATAPSSGSPSRGAARLYDADVWDSNIYGGTFKATLHCNGTNFGDRNLAQWRSSTDACRETAGGTPFDSNSVEVPNPTRNKIVIHPNEYQPGWGMIALVNWENATSVTADISPIVNRGRNYTVRYARDFYGAPAASGTCPSSGACNVSLPTKYTGGGPSSQFFTVYYVTGQQ